MQFEAVRYKEAKRGQKDVLQKKVEKIWEKQSYPPVRSQEVKRGKPWLVTFYLAIV